MTRILILYGTTDGHTGKVARFMATELRSRGALVDVFNAADTNPDPAGYEAVIVAGSVHAGGYQQPLVRWVQAHARALAAMPSAFVSVCLGILQEDVRVIRELDAIVNRFEAVTGWTPERVKLVAGALLYTRYGWLKRQVMRRISRKAGGSTDTSRDHEYTDWPDVRAFVGSFCSLPEHAAAPYDSHEGSPRGCVFATIED